MVALSAKRVNELLNKGVEGFKLIPMEQEAEQSDE
jgi:hypothetical protein